MKKFVFMVFVVIFILTPAFVAFADAIINPELSFYGKHKDKIVYLSRGFSVNGPDGYAYVREEPGARSEKTKVNNGEEVYIEYTCLYDGDYWGYYLWNWGNDYWNSGWIRMDELLVLYDFISFEEDHIYEFYYYTGDYAEIKETRSAIAWSWPGSGDALGTFEDLDTEHFYTYHAWKDGLDREWGFFGYWYGQRNIWFCLSDPMNSDIFAFNPAPAPSAWVPGTAHKEITMSGDSELSDSAYEEIRESDNSMLWIIIVLVAALVIITAVLIRVFWKPGKQKSEDTSPVER